MTPKEKKEAANKVLDDTMTVSQAKQRKLDLRAKDLEIRAGSLKRKQKNDADAKARRAKASADKDAKDKESAQDKKNAAGTSAVISSKKRREEIEAKKLGRLKDIADKRKEGVKKSLDRAKQVAPKTNISVDKRQSDATALTGLGKEVGKAAVGGARVGFNLAKAGAKSIGSGIAGAKADRAQAKADKKERKIEKRNEKLASARENEVKSRLNRRRLNKLNPFRGSGGSNSTDNAAEKRVAAKTRNDVAKSSTKSATKPESKLAAMVRKRKETDSATQKAKSDFQDRNISKNLKALDRGKDDRKVNTARIARRSSNVPVSTNRNTSKTMVNPARKALPSGQKALPPAGGVNRPNPQSSAGAGNMSDAQRARKDPAFRRELIKKRSKGMNEEFYQYLLEIEKMDKKTDKVIDIMKGKNKIEISPKISEGVTGGILIQDAEDYTPLEIETVDVIKAKPLKEYSTLVRQGIKVGGKKGGRAVQAGEKAAVAKGQEMKAKAAKPAEAGKGEKIGAVVGGVAGGLAGGVLDGPLPVGDIVGGIAGSKIGGAIGKKFDKKPPMKEEASDAMKDRQLERGGMGARRAPKKPISNTPNTFGKKKPAAGPSALDIVKSKIRTQYGDKAIMDTKKEHFDWRSELNYVEEEGKKDACYKKVKASAKVWPSAYASGRLVQCRKKGAANYGNSKKD
jgi:hypothetical protein